MLMTHYREPIDFSLRKLEEAENTLRKWKRAADSAGEAEAEVPAALIAALSDDLEHVERLPGITGAWLERRVGRQCPRRGRTLWQRYCSSASGLPEFRRHFSFGRTRLAVAVTIASAAGAGESAETIAEELLAATRKYASSELPAREVFALNESRNFDVINGQIEDRRAFNAKNWA
jgi:cysteinyl-tRNA synthetase